MKEIYFEMQNPRLIVVTVSSGWMNNITIPVGEEDGGLTVDPAYDCLQNLRN